MNGTATTPVQSDGPETLAQPSTTRTLIELPHNAPTEATVPTASGAVPTPVHPMMFWKFVEEDLDNIVTTWGRYNTEELVKSSPYYTKTEIDTDRDAREQFPEKGNVLTRVVHAVHPIPRDALQDMGPRCMHELGEKLEEERWDIDRDPAFDARVQETLARIDDALEFVFRVQMPGTRIVSGRQLTECKGNTWW
jgi:hypothetical protein